MYLHKYVSDGDTFYRVSGKSAKPGGAITLGPEEWKGYSTGAPIDNALKIISGSKFSREPVEKPKEKETNKKSCISERVRYLALRAQE